MPKQIKSDKGGAFISKEYKEFCKTQIINYIYGTADLHFGTGLVERTIQSMKNLILANLEDGLNLRESKNRALYVEIYQTFRNQENTVRNTLWTCPLNQSD